MLSDRFISKSERQMNDLRNRITNITMASEVLQKLDLAQSPLGKDLLTEDIGDLFDGYPVPSQIVCGGTILSSVNTRDDQGLVNYLVAFRKRTKRCHRHLAQALSSRCISRRR